MVYKITELKVSIILFGFAGLTLTGEINKPSTGGYTAFGKVACRLC